MQANVSAVLELTEDLVRRRSVTPEDAGCQDVLAERLTACGFHIERLNFGEVRNLWARLGDKSPLFVFAGHTDVVPSGPVEDWMNPPFEPTRIDGMLHGRGAADMKGSLAAMVIAAERFLATGPALDGSIGFLVTSDEEGRAVDGTARVVEHLNARGERIHYCLVGEPSSSEVLGDVIRNGRRGSLNGILEVRGVQGHVAYPDRAANPIHAALGALESLCRTSWDDGSADFPATSFQISNVNAGTGAENVIPGKLKVMFNFRFNTCQTPEGLRRKVTDVLDRAELDYRLDWQLSGMPFVTPAGAFTDVVSASVERVTGRRPTLSTSGGTSDGRFIAPTGAAVVELGPVNATIHKVDERVDIGDLEQLAEIFTDLLGQLLDSRRPRPA